MQQKFELQNRICVWCT